MSDVTATLRVESPDLALTETVAYDEAASVQPIAGAGTVPDLEGHLFTVQTDDFERFEDGLERDHTIEGFERVIDDGVEAVYRFEYGVEATVFSAAIAGVNGISHDWTNDETAWIVRVWLPDREALTSLWEYASDHDIEFVIERVSNNANFSEGESNLTADQRVAILLALEMGYFEEPRGATLNDIADELDISQPAVGGLLRRGLRRLVVSTVATKADDPVAER